jgi:hypothetical protein
MFAHESILRSSSRIALYSVLFGFGSPDMKASSLRSVTRR